MKVITMPIEELKPAPYNPREIDAKTKQKLKKSIQKFNLVEPLVWNRRTGHVVGGNQRLEVLKELGYEEVEVVEVDLDIQQEKALNLVLNRVQGDWDFLKLKDVLGSLNLDMYGFTGFDSEEITAILGGFEKIPEVEEFEETTIEEEKDHEIVRVICPIQRKIELFKLLHEHGFEVK